MDNIKKLDLKVIQDSEDNIEDRLKLNKGDQMSGRDRKMACVESQVDQLKWVTLAKFKKLCFRKFEK